MARRQRIWIPEMFYHVVSRGNRREPLFLDDYDFLELLQILDGVSLKVPYQLGSYCLMNNHFHLLIRSKEQSVSKVMSLVNKRYANYFNTKYKYEGHVFEKRFFSEPVMGRRGILDVSRYIHLNPLKVGMVTSVREYPWSSYPLYLSNTLASPSYFDKTFLLHYFPGTMEEKREQLIEYTEKPRVIL
ncbi:transposase [Bacillus sp. H-16]|nr:transposase [Alteribacter salitolerans]